MAASFWPRNRTRIGSGAATTRLNSCSCASVEALTAERRAVSSTDRAWRSPPLRGVPNPVPNPVSPSPPGRLGSHQGGPTSRRYVARTAWDGPARRRAPMTPVTPAGAGSTRRRGRRSLRSPVDPTGPHHRISVGELHQLGIARGCRRHGDLAEDTTGCAVDDRSGVGVDMAVDAGDDI